MTRSSFGMPDTSRAARYVLKDYVNARLLFAHPPPGITPEDFMSSSYTATLARLEAEFLGGKKRAPATHVVKNADTFVAPASGAPGGLEDPNAAPQKAQRQATSRQVKQSAASAPGRSGREKSSALDEVYFTASGPAPRPVVKGRSQGPIEQSEGIGYSRNTAFPHQRRLGPDGMPLLPHQQGRQGGLGGKKHFKVKEGKKRSGAGYD
jgi:large subunit GTPase 1